MNSMGIRLDTETPKKPAPQPAEPDVIEKPLEETSDDTDNPWKLILYNDEVHTFDEVIEQLIKALNCSYSKAEDITLKVHNNGKAVVYEGSFEECFEINTVLKEIQLVTEIKG